MEGFGPCIATMVAAELFNEREHAQIPVIFGAVTTGTNWKFLKLVENTAYIDLDEYYLKEIDLLMGIFVHIAQLESQGGSGSGG